MYFLCERMCRESLCAKTDLYQKENRSGSTMNEIGKRKAVVDDERRLLYAKSRQAKTKDVHLLYKK